MAEESDLRKLLRKLLTSKAYEGYHEALGEFIEDFAKLEAEAQKTLWRYTGVDEVVARCIFSGTRAKDAFSFIKKIATARGATKAIQDELADIVSQFGLINSLRNDIIHYGTQFDEEGNLVASGLKEVRQPVSAAILGDLIADIDKIIVHLWSHDMPNLDRELSNGVNAARQASWRYKPPPQDSDRQRNRESSRKRQRPPKASPQ